MEVTLSPGEHQITLTVTDSEGMSGSDQISILVERDAWGVYLPVILDRY